MGIHCPRCRQCFKYQSHLDRHLERKTKCEIVKKEEVEEVEEVEEYKCEYCLKVFKEKRILKVHNESCKWKDDPIRKLEIDLGIEIEPLNSSKKCRYCENMFTLNKN